MEKMPHLERRQNRRPNLRVLNERLVFGYDSTVYYTADLSVDFRTNITMLWGFSRIMLYERKYQITTFHRGSSHISRICLLFTDLQIRGQIYHRVDALLHECWSQIYTYIKLFCFSSHKFMEKLADWLIDKQPSA